MAPWEYSTLSPTQTLGAGLPSVLLHQGTRQDFGKPGPDSRAQTLGELGGDKSKSPRENRHKNQRLQMVFPINQATRQLHPPEPAGEKATSYRPSWPAPQESPPLL